MLECVGAAHTIATTVTDIKLHERPMLPAGIKLATFDTAKSMLGRANSAYDGEVVKWQRAMSIKHSSSGLT